MRSFGANEFRLGAMVWRLRFQSPAFARTGPMSFLNLRIGGRLYSGFGVLLLFCAALAGFAVSQLWGIHDQVGSMTQQSKNNIRAVEIGSELHANRRAILRYNFDHDEASFIESGKRLANTSDLLETAIQTTKSEERKASYKEALKDVAELKAKRVALGESAKQFVAGREALFSEGDKLTANVQKFVDDLVEQRFRRQEFG